MFPAPTTKKQTKNCSKAKSGAKKKPKKFQENEKWKVRMNIIQQRASRGSPENTEWFVFDHIPEHVSEPTVPEHIPEPTVLEVEPIEPLFETLKEMKKLDKMARLISEMLIREDVESESDESDEEYEYEPSYAQWYGPSPIFLIRKRDLR